MKCFAPWADPDIARRLNALRGRWKAISSSRGESTMTIADLAEIAGRTLVKRRGAEPAARYVVGDPAPSRSQKLFYGVCHAGVPWGPGPLAQSRAQEEIYPDSLENTRERCASAPKGWRSRQAKPSTHSLKVFHQLTQYGLDNHAHDLLLRSGRRRGPLAAGIGWLAAPRATVDAPALPSGAQPQHTGIG